MTIDSELSPTAFLHFQIPLLGLSLSVAANSPENVSGFDLSSTEKYVLFIRDLHVRLLAGGYHYTIREIHPPHK
ncbi:MAG: hypothetical protein WBJ10_11135 [Daejeonella sp.]|uniref:hypothetical protein n=1 Tax=Daejeonella sp. TaxID=2805397 RepID=UPI003C7377BC